MAGYAGIAAVGKSIERMLELAFAELQPVQGKTAHAVLIRTDDLKPAAVASAIGSYALSIFLYRADFNKTMRAAWSAVGHADGYSHLPLDLHFLLTAWADNAEHEYLILGRAMQALESAPVFSGPLLYDPVPGQEESQIGPGEAVQMVLEDISTEALMRIFDSLPTDYRLSVPYIGRIVRLDGRAAHPAPPVIDAAIPLRVQA